MQCFSFIPLTVSEEMIFEYFFENLPFMLPWQPVKFSNLDKIHMNRRGLLKKHFCKKKKKKKKKNLNICSETAKIANFHFSHYKSMETKSFHSNQEFLSDWNKKHNYLFPPSIDAICGIWIESASLLQRRSCLKMLKTDRRADDGCLPIL